MRKGYASLAVVGAVACAALFAVSQYPAATSLYTKNDIDMEFINYIAKYGKSYGTKEEFYMRAAQFQRTLGQLSLENSKNDNTFTLGVNKFADWTPAEYKSILGFKGGKRSSGR